MKYIGNWKDGKQDGQGHLIWASSANYKGQFKDGQPNGDGVFTSADGKSEYKGLWAYGILNGPGSLYVN